MHPEFYLVMMKEKCHLEILGTERSAILKCILNIQYVAFCTGVSDSGQGPVYGLLKSAIKFRLSRIAGIS